MLPHNDSLHPVYYFIKIPSKLHIKMFSQNFIKYANEIKIRKTSTIIHDVLRIKNMAALNYFKRFS